MLCSSLELRLKMPKTQRSFNFNFERKNVGDVDMILEIKISDLNLGWPLANTLYKRNSQELDHFKDISAPTHLDPSIKLVSNQGKAINRHIPELLM